MDFFLMINKSYEDVKTIIELVNFDMGSILIAAFYDKCWRDELFLLWLG